MDEVNQARMEIHRLKTLLRESEQSRMSRSQECSKLRTEVERETEAHGLAAGVAAALTDDVKRLEAIVAKVPKTADGVPVVQDLEAYCRSHGRITWVKILDIQRDGRVYCNVHYGIAFRSLELSTIYSTREAAEAAGGE